MTRCPLCEAEEHLVEGADFAVCRRCFTRVMPLCLKYRDTLAATLAPRGWSVTLAIHKKAGGAAQEDGMHDGAGHLTLRCRKAHIVIVTEVDHTALLAVLSRILADSFVAARRRRDAMKR